MSTVETNNNKNQALIVADNNSQASSRANSGRKPSEAQRDKLASLHQDGDNVVAKAFKGAGNLALDTAETSTLTTIGALKNAKKLAESNLESSGNMKNILLGTLATGFGVAGLKDLFDIPKIVQNPKFRDQKSPIFFTLAKLLTSSTLTLGVVRTVLGSAGKFSFGSIGVGIIGFAILNILTSTYENPQSPPAKLFNLFGLKDRVVDFMNIFGFRGHKNNI